VKLILLAKLQFGRDLISHLLSLHCESAYSARDLGDGALEIDREIQRSKEISGLKNQKQHFPLVAVIATRG